MQLMDLPVRRRALSAFPQCYATPALTLLAALLGAVRPPSLARSTVRKALHDLEVLGVVQVNRDGSLEIFEIGAVGQDGSVEPSAVAALIRERVPGGAAALSALTTNPSLATAEVGRLLEDAAGASWSLGTRTVMGKNFRSWARAAGVRTSHSREHSADQLPLDSSA
jgi:hypothetical protein